MSKIKILLVSVYLVFQLFVPATVHAASTALITEIQTGFTDAQAVEYQKEEFIELFNPSVQDIDVTNWKVQFLTSTHTGGIVPTRDIATLNGMFSGRSHLLLSSKDYINGADVYFGDANTPTSGMLAKTSGYVRVVDGADSLVDCIAWGVSASNLIAGCDRVASGHPAGYSTQRVLLDNEYLESDVVSRTPISPTGGGLFLPAPIDVCLNIVDIQATIPAGYFKNDVGDCVPAVIEDPVVDLCPNISGVQLVVPAGYTLNEVGQCIVIVSEPEPSCESAELNEIVPNPAGVDNNQEFVELYNPTNDVIDLSGCVLKVGSSQVSLSGNLGPALYKAVYGLTLPNSAGGVVTLLTTATESSVIYPENLSDDESWSLLDGAWQLTDIPTPGTENKPHSEEPSGKGASDNLEPCPAGKFRNPETNRCKNIAVEALLTPCNTNQYRSLDTNRCRNLISANTSLVACSSDQYRSLDTNRCRKISSASTSLIPCKEGYERNEDTNRCRKVAGSTTTNPLTNVASTVSKPVSYPVLIAVTFLAVSYGIYEYRLDIRNLFARRGK